MYHGTPENFKEFARTGQRLPALGTGYYFTNLPEKAAQYGDTIMPLYLKSEKLLDWKNLGQNKTKIIEHLRSIVPDDQIAGYGKSSMRSFPTHDIEGARKFFTDMQEITKDFHDRAKAKLSKEGDNFVISWQEPDLTKASPENLLNLAQRYDNDIARNLGFDGVKYGSETVVFSPTQIKSAIGNNGKFDPHTSVITARQRN